MTLVIGGKLVMSRRKDFMIVFRFFFFLILVLILPLFNLEKTTVPIVEPLTFSNTTSRQSQIRITPGSAKFLVSSRENSQSVKVQLEHISISDSMKNINQNVQSDTLASSTDFVFEERYFNIFELLNDSALTPHEPIIIDGNVQFEEIARSEGWNGTGSLNDPYVITNLNISGANDLIVIKNTNVYFLLVNNYLHHGANRALVLLNVTNGVVKNNILLKNVDDGIYLDQSTENVVLENNTISSNQGYGINLFKSLYNQIKNNYILNNLQGGVLLRGEKIGGQLDPVGEINITGNVFSNQSVAILIQHAREPVPDFLYSPLADTIIIANNTFQDNEVAIHLQWSSNVRIIQDTFIGSENDTKKGVLLWESDYNTVNESYFRQLTTSIYLFRSKTNWINGNFMKSADKFGVFLEESPSNYLFRNYFNVSAGIYIDGFKVEHYRQASVVENFINGWELLYVKDASNLRIGNGYGEIILVNVTNAIIEQESLANVSVGILLAYSSDVFIQSVQVSGNNFGLVAKQSRGVFISNVNVSSSLADSIRLLNSINVTIKDVRIFNSCNYGILLNESMMIRVENVVIEDNGNAGMFIWHSEDVTIIDSQISGNERDGIRALNAKNVSLMNVTLLNNGKNGVDLLNTYPASIENATIFDNGNDGVYLEDSGTFLGTNSYVRILFSHIERNGNAGVILNQSDKAIIDQNYIASQGNASVLVINSESIRFFRNNLNGNDGIGLYLDSETKDALIIFNDFIDNNNVGTNERDVGPQAIDDGTENVFDYNFWSDWKKTDQNRDGIIDSSYQVQGLARNEDPHPLISSVMNHHILRPPNLIRPSPGDVFTVNKYQQFLEISWFPAFDSWGHEVTYALYYSMNGGTAWELIIRDITVTTFLWNATMLSSSDSYLLRVVASDGRNLETMDDMSATFSIDASYYESLRNESASKGVIFEGFLMSLLFVAIFSILRQRLKKERGVS